MGEQKEITCKSCIVLGQCIRKLLGRNGDYSERRKNC